MTDVRLSVIVPTCGRASLTAAAGSVTGQLRDGDQALLVGDGGKPVARKLCALLRGFRYLEAHDERSRYGNHQRDAGMTLATGTHLLFLDDDDAFLPGALDTIRDALAVEPDRPHVFRMRYGQGHVLHGLELWERPEMVEQNVGTPMVVLPNRPYELSWLEAQLRARSACVSDFGFLAAAIDECGEPVWHRDCIAVVRP